MTDMKALQVTAHGRPGEVLAVRTRGPARARAGRGAGEGRGGVAQLQRHRPVPGEAGVGAHAPAVHPGHGCLRGGRRRRARGRRPWLGRRVVAITKTALGGIAEYAIAPAVSVFDAPDRLDDAEATAFVLTFQTSHLALFRRGRLTAGETLVVHAGGQRSGHGRHPTGQGRRGPGHRRGRRAGEGSPVRVARVPTWSSTTPPTTSSRRCWPTPATGAPTWSTTWPVGSSSSVRGGARPAAAATWPWASPTTTTTA